jgi:hypothetical protein
MTQECEWCGEQQKIFFTYIIKTGHITEETACNECVGQWFIECPEDIKYFGIIKKFEVE